MAYKSNEIKAGVMIVVGLVVFVVFLFAIFGIDFSDNTKEYNINLQYVGGISNGSLVKYRGMDVGQVKLISLPQDDFSPIALTLSVLKNTPIREDSRAYVTSIGIMAEQHIEITAGSPESPFLADGGTIETKNVMNFAQMSESMGDLSKQLELLIIRVSDLFNDDNRAHIASMMGNVDTLIQDGSEPFVDMLANMEKISSEFTYISKDVREMMTNNEGTLEEILGNLAETTESSQKLITEMQATIGELESMMSSNQTNFYGMMESLQLMSSNMEEFSQMIKEQPWLLVRKAAPPERKH